MKKLIISLIVMAMVFGAVMGIEARAEDLPTVAIITTGGTIAEKVDPKTGGAVPALTGKALISAVPGLSKVANIKVINYSDIDSSHMTPEMWAGLAKAVDKELASPDIKGAVITHGTDTMAEGAYFLELTLKTKKPVAFVGAMRDASDVSPDGPANILNAVRLVCSDEAKDWGVTVALNQYVNSARNVVKTQTTNVQTFTSGQKGYLGYMSMGKVYRYNKRPETPKFDIPEKLPKVVLLKTFAGADGSLVKYAVDSGAEGIVIEGLGSGNVNAEVDDAINYALKKDVAVVLSTRVYHGGVFAIYGDKGGGAMLKKAGVIMGGDITGPKARLLLMLALPAVGKDHAKLQKYYTM